MTPVEKLQAIMRLAADRRLPRGALAVGAVMVNLYRPDWGYCQPSNRRLATATGMAKTPTLHAIRTLLDLGYFVVVTPGTGRVPAKYRPSAQTFGLFGETTSEGFGLSEETSNGLSGETANTGFGLSGETTFQKVPRGPERKLKGPRKGDRSASAPSGARAGARPPRRTASTSSKQKQTNALAAIQARALDEEPPR